MDAVKRMLMFKLFSCHPAQLLDVFVERIVMSGGASFLV
jgi:hypothetical protein